MPPKNKPQFTHQDALVLDPTTFWLALPKLSPPLGERSTVSDPSGLYPTTKFSLTYDFPSHSRTPVHTNKPIDPYEAFKNVVNKIIEDITLLTVLMSYETEKVLLQLEELLQELKVAAST